MNKEELGLDENVLLIDAYFLNALIASSKKLFEYKLNRTLKDVLIGELIDYLALDMGLRPGENKCTVIFVYDASSAVFEHCEPQDIEKELNGKGFDDNIGSFVMLGAPTDNLIKRHDLFMNIMDVILDLKEIKRVGLFPQGDDYDADVCSKLDQMKSEDLSKMQLTLFGFKEEEHSNFHLSSPLFPILQALGVRGDETDS
jgi:hypothetical protein